MIDGTAAADLLNSGTSHATDLWALAALTAWERRLDECRSAALELGKGVAGDPTDEPAGGKFT